MFKANVKGFSFIGGEPSTWKFINESILFLHNKGKNVSVFSNGTILLRVMPDKVIINGTNLLGSSSKNIIYKNLANYKNNRVNIKLRFNIEPTMKSQEEEILNIAKQYAKSVSLSILYPSQFDKQLGTALYDLAYKLTSNSINTNISRATPLCIFSEKEREYLKANCFLKGKCSLPTKSFVVHPDGQTAQPCVELKIKGELSELKATSAKQLFMRRINKIKDNADLKCLNCDLSSECDGGCLAYKPTQQGH